LNIKGNKIFSEPLASSSGYRSDVAGPSGPSAKKWPYLTMEGAKNAKWPEKWSEWQFHGTRFTLLRLRKGYVCWLRRMLR
jgi:hypothetical protein